MYFTKLIVVSFLLQILQTAGFARADPGHLLFRSVRQVQRAGDGAVGTLPRRSLQLLLEEIHHEDRPYVG